LVSVPARSLFGVEIAALNRAAVVDEVARRMAMGRQELILTLNTDHVVHLRRNGAFRSAYRRATLVVPDGMPVVWTSRAAGLALPERITGTDLAEALVQRAAGEGWRLFLMGGQPGVADRAAERLRQRFPALRVAGTASPEWGFESSAAGVARLVQTINDAGTDLLLVSLGTPKQELWLAAHLERLRCRCAVGIGSGLDYHAGRMRRAPPWMRRAGLEWLWRLLHEPRRLWHRYLVDALAFVPVAARQILEARRQRAVGQGDRDLPAFRIGVVTPAYPPAPGGSELQAQALARALAGRVRTVEVVTVRRDRQQPKASRDGAARVRRLAAWRGGPLRRPSRFLSAFLHFSLRPRRYDLLHLYCVSSFTLGAMAAARLTRTRTLLRVSTSGPEGEIAHALEAPAGRLLWRLFLGADRFVAQRPSLEAELRAWGVPAERLETIPNLARILPRRTVTEVRKRQARAALGLPDRKVVLSLGRLAPDKRVGSLLDAWREVTRQRNAVLVIAGEGPERETLERRIASEFATGSVRLLSWQTEPGVLYEAADLFVVVSEREGFCNALAEAMGHGLAVVTTRVGLAVDWVEDGREALLLEAPEAGAVAGAIVRLLDDETLRRRLGGSARALAQREFGVESWAARHLELYSQLLEGGEAAKQVSEDPFG
jgi:N-acetylglucosaminyldiphosphoundecaprenol N-acetyl-beta-D-mannosaminyltransferase